MSKSRKEYAIWGVPKGQTEETLLMAKFDGEFIVGVRLARKLADRLGKEFGATKIRIQELDMSRDLDWMKETGIGR